VRRSLPRPLRALCLVLLCHSYSLIYVLNYALNLRRISSVRANTRCTSTS
jgi:hypothetical protein